jgi:hypothetical protein
MDAYRDGGSAKIAEVVTTSRRTARNGRITVDLGPVVANLVPPSGCDGSPLVGSVDEARASGPSNGVPGSSRSHTGRSLDRRRAASIGAEFTRVVSAVTIGTPHLELRERTANHPEGHPDGLELPAPRLSQRRYHDS